MKLEIDLCFESNKWPKKIILKDKDLFNLLTQETMRAAKAVNLCKTLSLSLIFVSDAKIKKYNSKFRNKNSATNVLSFPIEDFSKSGLTKFKGEFIYLGEVIFAFETIKMESDEQDKKFQDHLLHLFIHSMLHLLGYEHDAKKERKEMEKLEIKVLKKFGIENPYV
jgi:probable rRNA maturation factor